MVWYLCPAPLSYSSLCSKLDYLSSHVSKFMAYSLLFGCCLWISSMPLELWANPTRYIFMHHGSFCAGILRYTTHTFWLLVCHCGLFATYNGRGTDYGALFPGLQCRSDLLEEISVRSSRNSGIMGPWMIYLKAGEQSYVVHYEIQILFNQIQGKLERIY